MPPLVDHFFGKYANEFGRPKVGLSAEALDLLMNHAWPGNVRELEHVIECSLALSECVVITENDLALASSVLAKRPVESLQEAKAREIAQFEKNYIQNLLRACSGHITAPRTRRKRSACVLAVDTEASNRCVLRRIFDIRAKILILLYSDAHGGVAQLVRAWDS